MENVEAIGRITKWVMEMKTLGVTFESRITIKRQVLADFIAKFTP